ncbi:lysophospholipid acyltransferase family protein [Roseibium sp.]|uniref:lysophospholipid acyltransferase family protein n=1 Tax=Roseibium sp. TaxID=1936156 RepID=UPI003A97C4E2
MENRAPQSDTARAPSQLQKRRTHDLRLSDIPFSETYPAEPPVPPIAEIFSSDKGKQHTARLFWISHTLQGLANTALYQVLASLRPSIASTIGSLIADPTRWRYRDRIFARRIRENISKLRAYAHERRLTDTGVSHDFGPSNDDEAHKSWWRNISRTLAEFSIVNRLIWDRSIRVVGEENLMSARASGRPLVFTSVHLATWEVVIAATHIGPHGPSIGPFQPEPNRFSNRIVYLQRKARNQYLFPPGRKSAFRLSRLLQAGAASIIIFIDEVRQHQIHFPFFGRPAPSAGNGVVAIKLANSAGGLIVPIYLRRTKGVRFELVILPALYPDAQSSGRPTIAPERARTAPQTYDIAETLTRLNDLYEPIILENVEQWYMLSELRL